MNTRVEDILVVEDDAAIRELVATALRFTGFGVETAVSGGEALATIRNGDFDLAVLDVNLPDLDGFSVCRKLRADVNLIPIVFLTARDDPADLRAGFSGGADDYLTKPFSLDELLRINAVLRRSRPVVGDGAARLVCGDLSLDEDACLVLRAGQEIALSPTEFRLLRYLMLNRGRVVSKHQILEHAWEYDYAGDPAAVETYVSYLRRKIDDREAEVIRTVRGFGYSLRDSDGANGDRRL